MLAEAGPRSRENLLQPCAHAAGSLVALSPKHTCAAGLQAHLQHEDVHVAVGLGREHARAGDHAVHRPQDLPAGQQSSASDVSAAPLPQSHRAEIATGLLPKW